jgi:hypothetical protein
MFKTVKLLIAVVLAALVTVAVAPSAADARDIRTDAVILFCGAEEGTPRSETLISAFGTAKAPAHVAWGGSCEQIAVTLKESGFLEVGTDHHRLGDCGVYHFAR